MLVSFCFLAWRIPTPKRSPIGRRHNVDLLVCTYDEGLDVLEATLLGCAGITHPHVTRVLDDGRRDAQPPHTSHAARRPWDVKASHSNDSSSSSKRRKCSSPYVRR